jgi:predicted DNA-binding antitoxin AbrB/MazE fold protein
MSEYFSEAVVKSNGTLTLDGLPFKEGEKVDVVVRVHEAKLQNGDRYPLRGTPYKYDKPFESVAEEDWETTK